jgi:hypothetical protein
VAAADGRVTRVNQNNLGGKVVWLRPDKKDYTLYYAHLDSQLVRDGQAVSTGDTLGLMGNTGNARSTPPHLHFGIYALGGAIDPLPFINPNHPVASEIKANLRLLGKPVRAAEKTLSMFSDPARKILNSRVDRNTHIRILAATGNYYRVQLPDGQSGYIMSTAVDTMSSLGTIVIGNQQRVLHVPDSLSPASSILPAGSKVYRLAVFNDYNFIRADNQVTGWIKKEGS